MQKWGLCQLSRGTKRNNKRREGEEQWRNSNVMTTTNMYDNYELKQAERLL